MLLSKREFSDSKKSNFIKQQEASRLLSSLGIKAPLNKIPLSGPLSFEQHETYKMKEIVNKFLLAGDKFLPEMDLRQWNINKKTKKKSKKLKKQEIHNIFIKTNQIKLVFNLTWLMETLKI